MNGPCLGQTSLSSPQSGVGAQSVMACVWFDNEQSAADTVCHGHSPQRVQSATSAVCCRKSLLRAQPAADRVYCEHSLLRAQSIASTVCCEQSAMTAARSALRPTYHCALFQSQMRRSPNCFHSYLVAYRAGADQNVTDQSAKQPALPTDQNGNLCGVVRA